MTKNTKCGIILGVICLPIAIFVIYFWGCVFGVFDWTNNDDIVNILIWFVIVGIIVGLFCMFEHVSKKSSNKTGKYKDAMSLSDVIKTVKESGMNYKISLQLEDFSEVLPFLFDVFRYISFKFQLFIFIHFKKIMSNYSKQARDAWENLQHVNALLKDNGSNTALLKLRDEYEKKYERFHSAADGEKCKMHKDGWPKEFMDGMCENDLRAFAKENGYRMRVENPCGFGWTLYLYDASTVGEHWLYKDHASVFDGGYWLMAKAWKFISEHSLTGNRDGMPDYGGNMPKIDLDRILKPGDTVVLKRRKKVVTDEHGKPITAVYVGDNHFERNGEVGTGSGLAGKLLVKYTDFRQAYGTNGNKYWTFNGQRLADMRRNFKKERAA